MQLARILAVGALAGAFAGAQPVLSQDVTLEFVVWNYSLDTIQDNVSQVRGREPGHQGQRHRLCLARLPRQPGPRFRGNTPTDVIYGGQDWLPAWAAAGFFAPLDDVAPEGAVTSSPPTSRASR